MIELGREVQDRVTGFKGIAIATTHYMQGCDRVLVQPKVNKDGSIPDTQHFDEPDLEVIGDGVLPKLEPKSEEPSGGPIPIAFSRGFPTLRR